MMDKETVRVEERPSGRLSMLLDRSGPCAGLMVCRTVLLPMALLVFLFFTQSFSGSNMVSYYTITIFQASSVKVWV
jgi:hypothetical protein